MPRNPTPAQIEASRRNGAKSKGPKHQPILDSLPVGLTAAATCLPSEDQATFQQVLQSFLLHYQPQNDMEALCVEEMANATWRMRRLWIHEQHLIVHHATPGPATTLQEALSQQKQLPTLHRHWQQESRLRSAHQQSLTRLAALRRGLVPPPTNIPSEPKDSTLCTGLTHSLQNPTPQLTGPENPSHPSQLTVTGPASTSPASTLPSSTPSIPIPTLSGPFAMLSGAWRANSIALKAAALFVAALLVPSLGQAECAFISPLAGNASHTARSAGYRVQITPTASGAPTLANPPEINGYRKSKTNPTASIVRPARPMAAGQLRQAFGVWETPATRAAKRPAPAGVHLVENDLLMTRRSFLSSLGLGSAGLAPAAAAATRPPNIVLILLDDYGWRDTGFNGSTYYETPNIDRLSREGMVFTNGYSASAVCSPTRAAIITGQYPARLHLTAHLQGASNRLHHTKVLQPNARLALPLEAVTIAELLRAQGYRTACIGKWHLGTKGFLPSDQGFDVSLAGDEAGSTNNFFYPAWLKKVTLDGQPGDYLTDRLTTLAVDFIQANKERPFFLYLPHFAVHTPIEGKPDKVKKYNAKSRPDNPQNYGEYAAMIESADESVGRVLEALRASGVEGNTLVLFSSDNGGVTSREWKNRPVTSNLPLRVGKGHVYEGGIRVPTVVRWPGVTKPGSVCAEPIVSYDYAATFAEVAGVSAAKLPAMDGRSFTALLKGRSRGKRDLFWHYPHYSPQGGRPAAAIRNGDDKLILFFEDSRVELYNLKDDLGEAHDLAAAQPAKAAALRRRLEAWLAQTKAQLPSRNPQYDPAREFEAGAPDGPATAK